MRNGIHRGVAFKVVIFVVVSGLLISGVQAQTTLRGVVLASDPCQLQEYRPDVMCSAVQVPLRAVLRLAPRSIKVKGRRRGSSALISRVMLRSSQDGHFAIRRVPLGLYDLKLRRIQYNGLRYNVHQFITSPSRVSVTEQRGVQPLVIAVLKKKGPTSASNPGGGTVSEGSGAGDSDNEVVREVAGDCAAVDIGGT